MIIDSHNHPDWLGHNLFQFLQNMDDHQIDQTWLLSWEAPEDEYDPAYHSIMLSDPAGPVPFSRCLTYHRSAPDRFVLGYAPDPRRPSAIDRLKAAIDLHGVRVYGELKLRMVYDNPDAIRMFRFCGERALPVVVHIDYELDHGARYPRPSWWYGGGIEALERTLKACPDTVFVGHGPGFWAHISGDDQCASVAYPSGPVVAGGRVVQMLREHPSLHADLSAGSGRNALARDPEFGARFLDEFQDRLMFGRDSFDGQLHELLGSLSLPDEALAKIYAGNALRLAAPGA